MNNQPPNPGHNLIVRSPLWKQIDEAVGGCVLFVHAPAGYGKTSLLAQWASKSVRHSESVRWITLAKGDGDEKTFLIQFAIAIGSGGARRKLFSEFENLTIDGLHRLVLERLRNSDGRLLIVLDDYHLVESEQINSFLGKVTSHPVFHDHCLIVLSRTRPSIPVGKLWIEGQLTSLNASDLVMSEDEVGDMLALISPGLVGPSSKSVYQKTEGWAVAVRMAALVVEQNSGSKDPLSGFNGAQVDVAHYLAEHLTSDLSDDDMRFLMLLSPLDRFNIALSEELSGVDDAAARLARLERLGVPINFLDEERNWMRLHPVFQDFLLAQPFPQDSSNVGILAKTAEWFYAEGDIERAVDHAILAEDYDLAAQMLENSGGWRLLYAGAGEIRRVLAKLLSGLSEIKHAQFPRTWLGYAIMLAKDGDVFSANQEFERIEAQLVEPDQILRRELRLIAQLLALYADVPATRKETEALKNDLKYLAHDTIQNALTLNILCYHCLQFSAFDKSLNFGLLAVREFQRADAYFGEAHLHTHIGQAYFMQADTLAANRAYLKLRNSSQNLLGERSDLEAMAEALNAEVLVEQGDFSAAEHALSWALPQLEEGDCWFDILAAAYLASMRLHLISGRFTQAHKVLDQAGLVAVNRGFESLTELVYRERIYLLADGGAPSDARALAKLHGLEEDQIGDPQMNDLSRQLRGHVPAMLWARIHLMERNYEEALKCLSLLRNLQETSLAPLRSIRLEIFEIRIMLAVNQEQAGSQKLDQLLIHPSIEGVRTSFLDEGAGVISFLRRKQEVADLSSIARNNLAAILDAHDAQIYMSDEDVVSVTQRENAVLKLVESGLSNKEIAVTLGVSDSTVKFHMRNIMKKFNCSNRTSAVSNARKLGILDG